MRIAILNLTGGGMSGGYRKYLGNLLPRIAVLPGVEAILCVSPVQLDIFGREKPLRNVESIIVRPKGLFGAGIKQELSACLERYSPDVIFIPVERHFSFKGVPVVTMVQNMEPLSGVHQGNPLLEHVQHWFRARLARQGIRKAERVIAISGFVKEYLKNSCAVAEDRIGLIYYGMDTPDDILPKMPSILPAGWNNDFIFTAGSIRPTRGLEDIFLAMRQMRKDNTPVSGLIIAGTANPNMAAYQNKLRKMTKQLGIADKVRWAGHLERGEMAWCYRNCRLFVMSSRVESFGQIALEAMSFGCVCVSADNPCLPEIFGDGAIYYPPRDSKALAGVMTAVLSWDRAKRDEMSARARARASQFSWDTCAEKTMSELVKASKK